MSNLNKKGIADIISETLGITKKDALVNVDLVFDTITNALANGNTVDIFGFGKFEVKERAERKGINPATKETITIPATKVPGFKASKTLKDQVK